MIETLALYLHLLSNFLAGGVLQLVPLIQLEANCKERNGVTLMTSNAKTVSLTLPPLVVLLDDQVNQLFIFESFPLVLPHFLGVSPFIGTEQIDIEDHFACRRLQSRT